MTLSTDIKGYKVCLCLYLDGDGSDTYLQVYLQLVKGSYDDNQYWPMRRKFEIKLLNQISDCDHHSMTIITYDDQTPDIGGRTTGWGIA